VSAHPRQHRRPQPRPPNDLDEAGLVWIALNVDGHLIAVAEGGFAVDEIGGLGPPLVLFGTLAVAAGLFLGLKADDGDDPAISVTPLVLPSQPAAPGARSCTHMLRAASRACGLDVLALPNPLLQSDHTGAAWIREYDWCIDRDRDGLACER
jgi:Excalibur calcium-binding domain